VVVRNKLVFRQKAAICVAEFIQVLTGAFVRAQPAWAEVFVVVVVGLMVAKFALTWTLRKHQLLQTHVAGEFIPVLTPIFVLKNDTGEAVAVAIRTEAAFHVHVTHFKNVRPRGGAGQCVTHVLEISIMLCSHEIRTSDALGLE
jgi:hypothetical protein